MSDAGIEGVVAHPTYLGHIRRFFIEDDFVCMRAQGIDLETYFGVRFNAERIFFKVRDGEMPPPAHGRPWSQAMVGTFYNWMRDGFTRGEAGCVPVCGVGARSA